MSLFNIHVQVPTTSEKTEEANEVETTRKVKRGNVMKEAGAHEIEECEDPDKDKDVYVITKVGT